MSILRIRKKRYPACLIFLLAISVILLDSPSYAYTYTLVADFLCDLGKTYYQRGNIPDALHEFKKALLLNPKQKTALEYIKLIEGGKPTVSPSTTAPIVVSPSTTAPIVVSPSTTAPIVVSPQDKRREHVIEQEIQKLKIIKPEVPPKKILPEEAPPSQALILNEKLKAAQSGTKLQIEKGKSIVIRGKDIVKWLVTAEGIADIERKNNDELEVKAKEIGSTFLHIWDKDGRWTFAVDVTYPKPAAPSVSEEYRRELEKAGVFKFSYGLDWNTFEKGRRLTQGKLNRQTLTFSQSLGLTGQTPYGDFDSALEIKRLRDTTDLTYLTVGLTNAKIGKLKDFSIRGFDYSPGFYNLVFPGQGLRGAKIYGNTFDKHLSYIAFWGREGGGRYGVLSPGLGKPRRSYLSGVDINYYRENASFGLTFVEGWGQDRANYLNPRAIDFDVRYNFDKMYLGYEIGSDSETFANLLNIGFKVPKLKLGAELRYIDKEFLNIISYGWRRGELGGLFSLNYDPAPYLSITSRLDAYKDRLFPRLGYEDRFNFNFDSSATYSLNQTTNLRINYENINTLGRLSPQKSQGAGLYLNKSFPNFRRLYTFLSYRYNETENPDSPLYNYINHKTSAGLSFNLLWDIYYHLTEEFNWLTETNTDAESNPHSLVTGIDYTHRLFNTPFYTTMRLLYRDEEGTGSRLSFLAGEDYLEGSAEFSYRPDPDTNIFLTNRIRNVWQERPDVEKRMEFDIRFGLRKLLDTGFHWNPVCTIQGYAFKDINADGIKQDGEEGIEGIKIWLGKKKSTTTNANGFYKFGKVRAKRIYITLDISSAPAGFVLTTADAYQIDIVQGAKIESNFGFASQTEISGIVFEDKNENGKFDIDEKGIPDIVLRLKDGKESITDDSGRYYFRGLKPGDYEIIFDLNTLPVRFMPKVAITKKVTLFEGTKFIHNIPLGLVK